MLKISKSQFDRGRESSAKRFRESVANELHKLFGLEGKVPHPQAKHATDMAYEFIERRSAEKVRMKDCLMLAFVLFSSGQNAKLLLSEAPLSNELVDVSKRIETAFAFTQDIASRTSHSEH